MATTRQRTSLPTLPADTPLVGPAATLWATAILEALKAPANNANVNSLIGWFHNEGGGGENNPMNTTLGSNYPSINSVGVRSYPDPNVGVSYTAQTLLGGYPAIVQQLQAGQGLGDTSGGVASELSKWSGGGYSSITPISASGTIPKQAIGPGPNGGIVRPGGSPAGSSGSADAASSLLASYQQNLEQPTQSTTDYVSLSGDLFGWVPGYDAISSSISDINGFFSFISWIFSPVTLLRAVEFLTGAGLIAFGLETSFKSVPPQQQKGAGGVVNGFKKYGKLIS